MERTRKAMRFIPFRKRDVIEMCLRDGRMTAQQQAAFRSFAALLQSLYHFEFHEQLEALKDAYAPMNPDRDTRRLGNDKPGNDFVTLLDKVLCNANYEVLSQAELERALTESSLFNLRLDIDFNEFSEVRVYTRGESTRRETIRRFYLFKREVTFLNYDRVAIYIRFREDAPSSQYHKPGATLLKLFQNVPRADIEMLFPNTRLGMRLIDKLMIGVPAVAGGAVVLTTKVGASLLLIGSLIGFWVGLHSEPVTLDQATLIGLAAALGGLGSFIWKQFVNFKNRKLTFMQSLTENLYFKNLDNNAGVFHRLVDDAEEEECKEALIAYYFLLTRDGIGSANQLDQLVETWFKDEWKTQLDFEVEDALGKLFELGLVRETLEPLSLDDALVSLDQRWDNYFHFRKTNPETSHG